MCRRLTGGLQGDGTARSHPPCRQRIHRSQRQLSLPGAAVPTKTRCPSEAASDPGPSAVNVCPSSLHPATRPSAAPARTHAQRNARPLPAPTDVPRARSEWRPFAAEGSGNRSRLARQGRAAAGRRCGSHNAPRVTCARG